MIITALMLKRLIIQNLEIRIMMFLALTVFIVCKAVILGLDDCKYFIIEKYTKRIAVKFAFKLYPQYHRRRRAENSIGG